MAYVRLSEPPTNILEMMVFSAPCTGFIYAETKIIAAQDSTNVRTTTTPSLHRRPITVLHADFFHLMCLCFAMSITPYNSVTATPAVVDGFLCVVCLEHPTIRGKRRHGQIILYAILNVSGAFQYFELS